MASTATTELLERLDRLVNRARVLLESDPKFDAAMDKLDQLAGRPPKLADEVARLRAENLDLRGRCTRVRNVQLFYALRAESFDDAKRHIENARAELGREVYREHS